MRSRREVNLRKAVRRGRALIAGGNLPAPNRKTAAELLAWLQDRYHLLPLQSKRALAVARDNVLFNPPLREKLPPGEKPRPAAFAIPGFGGKWPVYVFIDLASGCFSVEDNAELRDRLTAVQGLDADDLRNPWMVYNYMHCKKLYGEDGDGHTARP